jgi:hypothetical protein
MAEAAGGNNAVPRTQGKVQGYAPSWVDRFTGWVDRLPGPSWLFYLVFGLALGFTFTVVQWREGSYPVGTFRPFHIFFAGQIAYLLALMPFLDKSAVKALEAFRPALNVSQAEYAELRYRLTTLPARPTLLASLAGAASAIPQLAFGFLNFFGIATSPVSTVFAWAAAVVMECVAGALVYHTIHQLRLVSRIYTKLAAVDLFELGPLYAFSGLTARTALGLIVWAYGWFSTTPELLSEPIGILYGLSYGALAAATFAWPLLGIHRRLGHEKQRLLGEGSQRLKATIAELHRRVDAGELRGMDDMNKAIASLEIEQHIISKIPTWPWQPETARLLATALLLPLGMWITQAILNVIMGP